MRDIEELNERFSDRVHFIDGGLATELEARGHDISGKLWSGHVLLNDVAAIEQLHYDYLVAGADIIITASYQVSIPGMREAGYSRQDALSALELSVEAGTRARRRWCAAKAVTSWDEQPLIAASVGPYGAYLADGSEYTGDYELDAAGLQAFHRERLELFIQSDADLLAFETVPSLTEALAYADLVKAFGGPPAWISFTCRDGEHLSDGTHIAEAIRTLLRSYPNWIAIGVNCTPPQHVERALTTMAKETNICLVSYPNSGEAWDADHRCWTGENDAIAFTDYAKRWLARGARLIGGCCRTGPSHIANLRASLGNN